MPDARKKTFDPTLILDPGWMISYGADDVGDAHLFSQHRQSSQLEPEKKLQLAVLEDAIVTWMQRNGSKKMVREAKNVAQWLELPEPSTPFDFVAICDSIFPSIDPRHLARKILAIPPRVNSKRGPRSSYRSVR